MYYYISKLEEKVEVKDFAQKGFISKSMMKFRKTKYCNINY